MESRGLDYLTNVIYINLLDIRLSGQGSDNVAMLYPRGHG